MDSGLTSHHTAVQKAERERERELGGWVYEMTHNAGQHLGWVTPD